MQIELAYVTLEYDVKMMAYYDITIHHQHQM